MTYQEVAEMVSSIGLPFAYYSFPEKSAPPLPYLIYYFPNSADFAADNKNYQPGETLNIELYTENKDFALEKNVEDVLNAHGLVFDRAESFLTSEEMYEVLFTTNVVIKEN